MLFRVGYRLQGSFNPNQYEVKRFIGNGMNGEVYEIVDHNDGATKAVKVSTNELMLEREAEAAKRIVHQNVAKYFEYRESSIDDSGIYYIVMEYLPGGDLRTRIEEHQTKRELLDVELLLDWMQQLASGLSAINEFLIHRDLKPENVLLSNKTLKISDFGLSKYVTEATRTKTYKGEGTYPYMAPETWELGTQNVATDIYSLGIMFYELVTLQRPFDAQNWIDWSQKHRFALPPHAREINPQIGNVLDAMIHKMMDKDLSKRYQSAQEILQVLRQYSARGEDRQSSGVLDSIIATAQQRYEHEAEKEHTAKLEDERKRELSQKADYSFKELLSVLDRHVSTINEQLQACMVKKVEPGESNRVAYACYGKYLVLGFLPIIDAADNYKPHGPNLAKEKGVIGSAYLYLAEGLNKKEGINFLLIKDQDKTYGDWKICEIRDHALMRNQSKYQPFAVLDAKGMVHDLLMHEAGVMDIHTVSIRDFKEDDFLPFLNKLVSAP